MAKSPTKSATDRDRVWARAVVDPDVTQMFTGAGVLEVAVHRVPVEV